METQGENRKKHVGIGKQVSMRQRKTREIKRWMMRIDSWTGWPVRRYCKCTRATVTEKQWKEEGDGWVMAKG